MSVLPCACLLLIVCYLGEGVVSHYTPGPGTHYIAQAGLRLKVVPLPQLPVSWNYRYCCARLHSQLYRIKS